MLSDCSRWDTECVGTAAERDGTKSLNPRRAALAWGAEVAANVLLFIFSVLHCAAVGETAVNTN